MDSFTKVCLSLSDDKLSLLGRVGMHVCGNPFIGFFLRSLYFKRFVKGHKFKKCLDAGCGSGLYAFYLAQLYPETFVTAIDKDKAAIESNKAVQKKMDIKNIEFIQIDMTRMENVTKYDFIYLIGVLQYMSAQETKRVLGNFYRSLKGKGILFLCESLKDWEKMRVINPKYYSRMFERAKEQFPGQIYDRKELRELLNEIGFEIVHMQVSKGWWGILAWELDQIFMEYNLRWVKFLLMPFMKILCWVDTFINYRKGNEVVIVARA